MLARINVASILVAVIMLSLLNAASFFMPTDTQVKARYETSQWQNVQSSLEQELKDAPFKVTPQFIELFTLARLGYEGCVIDSSYQGSQALFTCFLDGKPLAGVNKAMVYIWIITLMIAALALATLVVWQYRCVKNLRNAAPPDYRVRRFWYWPAKKPHNFIGVYPYWSLLVSSDKHIARLHIVFLAALFLL